MIVHSFCAFAFAFAFGLTISSPAIPPGPLEPALKLPEAPFRKQCRSDTKFAEWVPREHCWNGVKLTAVPNKIYSNPDHYQCCFLKECPPLHNKAAPNFLYNCMTITQCTTVATSGPGEIDPTFPAIPTEFTTDSRCPDNIKDIGCCTIKLPLEDPQPLPGAGETYKWQDVPLLSMAGDQGGDEVNDQVPATQDDLVPGLKFPSQLSSIEVQPPAAGVQVASSEMQPFPEMIPWNQFSYVPDTLGLSFD